MKEYKFLTFALLIFMLGCFFYGIITIIQSEDNAVTSVTGGFIEDEMDFKNKETLFENSIKLYSREYKRKGIFILIVSFTGILAMIDEIYIKTKSYNFTKILLLIFLTSSFFYSIPMIKQSEDNAVTFITESLAAEGMKPEDNMEQFENSIELCSKEYKRKGITVLIISSIGVIGTIYKMYISRRGNTV